MAGQAPLENRWESTRSKLQIARWIMVATNAALTVGWVALALLGSPGIMTIGLVVIGVLISARFTKALLARNFDDVPEPVPALLWIGQVLVWLFGSSEIRNFHTFEAASLTEILIPVQDIWPLVMIGCGVAGRVWSSKLPKARERDAIELARQREMDYEQRVIRDQTVLDKPSRPGWQTGWEPAILEPLPVNRGPHTYGDPGIGLAGSGFGAAAIAAGQTGELNFAKALSREGFLASHATFWSVHMPSEDLGPSEKFTSDIDCVIVTDEKIYLVDVKNYLQGDVRWFTEGGQLHVVDQETGWRIGLPRKMSKNMNLARDMVSLRMERIGVTRAVVPVVVFMPTEMGMGDVQGAVWPGSIPSTTLPEFLRTLGGERAFNPNHPDAEHIVRVFRWLTKDSSGEAARPGQFARKKATRRQAPTQTPAQTPKTPLVPTADATELQKKPDHKGDTDVPLEETSAATAAPAVEEAPGTAPAVEEQVEAPPKAPSKHVADLDWDF